MTKSTTFLGFGNDGACVKIVLSSNSNLEQLNKELDRRWPPRGLKRSGRGFREPEFRVDIAGSSSDPAVIIDDQPVPGGWDRVESTLGLFAAEHLLGWVAVHAALIVVDRGAVVLPGPSHCGKSTLAAAAQERGLQVLSDEFTLVDPENGLVQGWPRPLRIRRPGKIERQDLHQIEHTRAFQNHRVVLVGAFQYEPSTKSITEISPADMAIKILENTVCGNVRPEDSFRAALALVKSAKLLAGSRSDSHLTWDLILERIDD